MAVSAGTAYVDVLPNMSKFAPAVSAQSAGASSKLAMLGKTGALAVAAVGVASVKMAADFEQSMRNVNSIAKLPEPAFDRLNEQVLGLAGKTAQAPQTLSEGLYDLVSSGFDAKESLTILKSSAIAATAGMTDTATSTKAVASVLNAYKLPASKAQSVSDALFKTVEVGVISFEELAGNIGDVLAPANSIGVPLEQVGAAMATMTKQGESAPEAATKLKAAMTALVKPSDEMQVALKELNVESGADLIKKFGSLQAALQAVRKTTDGSSESMNKLFPNIRAAQGALELTGPAARGAAKDLDKVSDSSGAARAAFEEQSKSFAVQFQKLKAQISVLAIEIGNALLPVLTEVTKALNEYLIPAWNQLKAIVGPVLSFINEHISVLGRYLLIVFGPAIFVLIALFPKLKSAASAAFNAIKTAGAAVVGWLRGAWQTVRGAAVAAFNAIRNAGSAVMAWLRGAFQKVASVARSVWSVVRTVATVAFAAIKAATAPLRAQVVNAFNTIKTIGTAVWRVIQVVARAAMSVIRAAAGPVRTAVTSAFNAIKGVAQAVFSAVRSVAVDAFNGIKSAISTVRGVASSAFGAVASAVRSVIGVVNEAIGVVRSLVSAISGAISDAQNLAHTVSSLPGKALSLLPGLAAGGPVSRGSPYIVGEAGPELFVPSLAGRVVPNHRLAGALAPGSGTLAFTITNWETGQGYIRRLAAAEDTGWRLHDRQRQRMRP